MQKIKILLEDGTLVLQKLKEVKEKFIYVIHYIQYYLIIKNSKIEIRKNGKKYKKYSLEKIKNKWGSFATISLRNDCKIKDIAEVLGHRRIETTEKYYISSTEKDKI